VKRAYRLLAKRHHPDTAGPAAMARFLAIQQAYESIVSASGRGARGPAPARGERRDATGDWYAAARDAAHGRARQGRADARRSGPGDPGHRRGGRRTAEGADAAGDSAPRTATIGSTTYDDAVPGEPEWHGSAWYGAASGTYWTVNPREYADPRKHGPEYLARAAATARDAAIREARQRGGPRTDARAGGSQADAPAPTPTGLRAARSPVDAMIVRLRRLLRPTRPDPRVR
jgi:hypothetical protein